MTSWSSSLLVTVKRLHCMDSSNGLHDLYDVIFLDCLERLCFIDCARCRKQLSASADVSVCCFQIAAANFFADDNLARALPIHGP